jgi:hypothetical protein
MYYVYILRRADDSFYVGSAQDLDARLKAHNEGRGAAYTFKRRSPRPSGLFRSIRLRRRRLKVREVVSFPRPKNFKFRHFLGSTVLSLSSRLSGP